MHAPLEPHTEQVPEFEQHVPPAQEPLTHWLLALQDEPADSFATHVPPDRYDDDWHAVQKPLDDEHAVQVDDTPDEQHQPLGPQNPDAHCELDVHVDPVPLWGVHDPEDSVYPVKQEEQVPVEEHAAQEVLVPLAQHLEPKQFPDVHITFEEHDPPLATFATHVDPVL
jgi:hypothetical protein